MNGARKVIDLLVEQDHMRSLQKSLFARAMRLFDDGYTPDEIYGVVKKQEGPLPAHFVDTIKAAWQEYKRRGFA